MKDWEQIAMSYKDTALQWKSLYEEQVEVSRRLERATRGAIAVANDAIAELRGEYAADPRRDT